MNTDLEGNESAKEALRPLRADHDVAGESLEGSGFEEEIPDPDFEWRD